MNRPSSRLPIPRAAAIAIVGATLLLAAAAGPSGAAPIGRPHTAERQWVVGVVGGSEKVEVEVAGSTSRGDLQSNLVLGEAAYGFTPDAEFYLRIGGSAEELRMGAVRDLGSAVAWGLGIRSVLYESWRDWRILGDIQYLSRPGHAWGAADIDVWEYQMATAIEVKLEDFYPYGGVFYNNLEVESNNQGIYRDQKNDNRIGVYLGVGWEPRTDWALHVEGRMIHGPGVSGGIAHRF